MGVTLGKGFGIVGIVALAAVIGWLIYSIYVGVRNERLMLAARQKEQTTTFRERMKLTPPVSKTKVAEDQGSTAPRQVSGELREESLVKHTDNPGIAEPLDRHPLLNAKEEEHKGYVYLEPGPSEHDLEKGQRWKLATL